MEERNSRLIEKMNSIVDVVFISVLWVLFSLPIITMGAASSAAYATVIKVVRQSRGYVWKTFWAAFRQNLKQGILIQLAVILVYAVFAFVIYICYHNNVSMVTQVYMVFTCAMACAILLFLIHLFALVARFQSDLGQLMHVALLLSTHFFLYDLSITLLALLLIGLSIYYPPLLFFTPGGFFYLSSLFQEKMFHKYINYPQDIDTPDDLGHSVEIDGLNQKDSNE